MYIFLSLEYGIREFGMELEFGQEVVEVLPKIFYCTTSIKVTIINSKMLRCATGFHASLRCSKAFVPRASRRHLGAAALGGMDEYKKITAQITKQSVGIQFPADAKGARSTTTGSKRVIAAALRGSGAPEGEALAKEVEAEKDWRFGYPKHFMNLVRLSARRYNKDLL
jgi:hypothetical protein